MKTELVDLDKICAFYLTRDDENSKESPITLLRKEREDRVARDAEIKELFRPLMSISVVALDFVDEGGISLRDWDKIKANLKKALVLLGGGK